jgi:hypothetical protein
MGLVVEIEFLRAIHLLACIIHLAFTFAIPLSLDLWSGVDVVTFDFNVTVLNSVHTVLPSGFSTGKLRYAFVLFLVELVTCLFHFSLAFPFYERYMTSISQCRNPPRWIEYAFTASSMFLLISFSCGVVEVEFLVTLTTLLATTMLFGLIQEMYNRPLSEDKWVIDGYLQRCLPLICGFIPFTVAYTLILRRLFVISSSESVDLDDGQSVSVPSFVYAIVFGELLLFLGFPIIMFMQIRSRPREFVSYEKRYMMLSLISKTFLASILIANSMYLS